MRGRLPQALEAARQALEIKKGLTGFPFLGLDTFVYGMLAHLCRGGTSDVEKLMTQFIEEYDIEALARRGGFRYLYLLGFIGWRLNQPDVTRQMYAVLRQVENDPQMPLGRVCRRLVRALLEISTQNWSRAEETLKAVADHDHCLPVFTHDARMLLIHVYSRRHDNTDEALSQLASLLEICEREHAIGFMLPYTRTVLPLLQLAAAALMAVIAFRQSRAIKR